MKYYVLNSTPLYFGWQYINLCCVYIVLQVNITQVIIIRCTMCTCENYPTVVGKVQHIET